MAISHAFRPRLVVFTDLDGTLLDRDGYGHEPAAPALAALRETGAALVLASSKTAAEIADLHTNLGLGETPAIVENGAGLYRPGAPGTDKPTHARLRAVLDGLAPDLRDGFRGFGDMTAGEVAALTGLSRDAARRARARAFSEPGLWQGSAGGLEAFRAALAKAGLDVREGGRFITLSFGASKADRMDEVLRLLGGGLTLALGDAPNDIEMLEVADFGVVIRNDHGPGIPPLAGEAEGRITRSTRPGPAGWNVAVLDFLANRVPE